MSIEHNLRLARLWYEEMWSTPNLDLVDEIVDPAYDPDWISIDATGPEQVKIEIRYFRSVFPDLVYQIVDLAPQEDRVWIRYTASATQKGSAWGFAPNEKQVNFAGATILHTNQEGKVVDRWGAFCFYDLLADLGHVPPLWELAGRLKEPPGN